MSRLTDGPADEEAVCVCGRSIVKKWGLWFHLVTGSERCWTSNDAATDGRARPEESGETP